jgi:hypothetical protein
MEVAMGQIAHIRYDGGALLLPAQDPYDRELVFEEAEFCARRHGSVGVRLGRTEIRISLADATVPCEDCHHPVGLLAFVIERHRFCAHCAKRCMGCRAEE